MSEQLVGGGPAALASVPGDDDTTGAQPGSRAVADSTIRVDVDPGDAPRC